MGNRKKDSQHNNLDLSSSSEDMLFLSGMELLSKEHSLNLDAGIDVGDSSVKQLNSNSSVAQCHYNLGHSIFLKRSLRYYGHHYSRRNSGSLVHPPISHGKIGPLCDENYPSSSVNTTQSLDALQMVGQKHWADRKELVLVHW